MKPYFLAHTINLDTNEWSQTTFQKRRDAILYIKSQVKYPGEYNLNYTTGYWNEQATIFQKNEIETGNGHYPLYREGSIDFRKHWDFEKEKCKFDGFIIYKKPSEGIEFAVPGLYYWYLNYCPIPDKVKQKEDFPEVYDGDYHYFLYILRCILLRKFGVVLKKRQSGYTLKNMAIKLNAIWFGKSLMSKIFAWDSDKVEESWSFMEKYRDHINEHCGWKRGFDPSKKLDWQVRRKQTDGSYKGNNSKCKGFTTKQDPTNGIGGSAAVIFGEESGANPTLDQTHEFISSNVALGGLTTGLIIYSGAVGKLEQAEPLKEFITHPNDHNFLGCPNDILEDIELGEEVGFFAPEWWNYVSVEEDEDGNPYGEVVKCFDVWGNSDKPKSMAEIAKWRKKAESKSPEKFRYYCSQRPLSITEAFAFRKEARFPQRFVQAQKRRIEDKIYPVEHVEIKANHLGELEFVKANKLPISVFPFPKAAPDKEGCIQLFERPFCKKPELGKYYTASIDPVKDGKTTTSESLFSIIVYKLDVEVTRHGEESSTFIEPGKIVAEWTGRFDDNNKTCERAMHLLEIFGATAVCEVNVAEFVTYMITKKRQHYLVTKDQMIFLKEYGSNLNAFQTYGWKNTGKIFENLLIPYSISFLTEELDRETLVDGTVVRTKYGVERIGGFLMLLKEMEVYQPGMNVDRLIAFSALCAYVKILLANRGYAKRIEYVEGVTKKIDPSLYAKPKAFFKERGQADPKYSVKKGPFKHLK